MVSKKLRKHIREVLRTKKSPHSIAFGFALGTLIGTLPIPFIDYLIGLIIILALPRISKYSLIAGITLWNPLTKIPVYTASYKLGDFLFRNYSMVPLEVEWQNQIYMLTRRFIVGNILIAAGITLSSYIFMFSFVYMVKRIAQGRKLGNNSNS